MSPARDCQTPSQWNSKIFGTDHLPKGSKWDYLFIPHFWHRAAFDDDLNRLLACLWIWKISDCYVKSLKLISLGIYENCRLLAFGHRTMLKSNCPNWMKKNQPVTKIPPVNLFHSDAGQRLLIYSAHIPVLPPVDLFSTLFFPLLTGVLTNKFKKLHTSTYRTRSPRTVQSPQI